MYILIATPLYPPDIGGPATYSSELQNALEAEGHTVEVAIFNDFLPYPSGIRHILFFLRMLSKLKNVDFVIILDTVSVALPAILTTTLLRKKSVIRIGGDFVWEHYCNRTKHKVFLSQFYTSVHTLSLKERMLVWLQRYCILPLAHRIVFSTPWQRNIWHTPYRLRDTQITVIENSYSFDVGQYGSENKIPSSRVVWIGRDIPLKNVDYLDMAVSRVHARIPSLVYEKYSGISHDEVLRVLAGARVLVIPSVSEVSPNLAIEAITLGVPVVLTKDCGLEDVLMEVVVWVDPLQVTDIENAIVRLMDDDYFMQIKVRMQKFKKERSYSDVAKEFLQLMEGA